MLLKAFYYLIECAIFCLFISKNYTQLSVIQKKYQNETLTNAGMKHIIIAASIDVNASTVSQELSQNTTYRLLTQSEFITINA